MVGLRGRDIGRGLIERDLEVAVVDPRQHLAGLHRLVVADQHLIADSRETFGAIVVLSAFT